MGGVKFELLICPFFHVAVPLFFFISGYGFYLTYRNDLNAVKLRLKVFNLYKKYWLVFFTAVPICFALGMLQFNVREFALNFIGLSSSYCGEWWFFSTYLEINILFWIIKNFRHSTKNCKDSNILIGITSILFATVGYGMKYFLEKNNFNTDSLIWNELYYLLIKQPMFAAGYLSAKTDLIDRIYFWIVAKKNVFRYLVVLFGLFIVVYMPYINFIPETYLYVLYLPIFVLYFCLLDNCISKCITAFFEWMSKYSTYMWLVHSILLYRFFQRVIYYFEWSVLCWITLIVMSLICAIILSKIQNGIEKLTVRVSQYMKWI